MLFGLPSLARAELVYDNSGNTLRVFISRQEEFGDEITFGGTARTLTAMAFEVVGERELPAGAAVQFRLYRPNGPLPPPPEPAVRPPGDLLYQSPVIPMRAGVTPIRIEDLSIPVPESVIWTVEFSGAGVQSGERAGLQVYHPPLVGRSFRDYWVRDPDRFRLYVLEDGTAASFAARFEAQPDPPTSLTVVPGTNGAVTLRVTGPIGSDQLVEVSNDLRSWRTIGLVTLTTQPTGTFVHVPGQSHPTAYYRMRASPHPGATVFLTRVVRENDGSATVTLSGPRNSEHLLEASSDRLEWKPIDIIRFGATNLVYRDASATNTPLRFYRTRRPEGTAAIYLIESIERRSGSASVLTCLGSPNGSQVTVEASPDFVNWSTIGFLTFTTSRATFTDLQSVAEGRRFYRLRL